MEKRLQLLEAEVECPFLLVWGEAISLQVRAKECAQFMKPLGHLPLQSIALPEEMVPDLSLNNVTQDKMRLR